MENNITYEEYCRISEEFKKRLIEIPFNKESYQDRKRLLNDYVDFMSKHSDYYIRQAEQNCEEEDEDISYTLSMMELKN